MTAILIRTVLIYLLLVVAMRLMGKRQIGELEISDLVTTLLISEIAALPITDSSVPLSHAALPIAAVVCFEVVSSALTASFPSLKKLLTARPATLIRDGKLCGSAMKRARISADELISELRQHQIGDIAEVRYAILEQNGKISVILKAEHRPPTVKELHRSVCDSGLFHIIIDKGVLNRHSLQDLQLSEETVARILSERGLHRKDIYLMMMNDRGDVRVISRQEV